MPRTMKEELVTWYTIRRNYDGAFFCARKSYSDDGHGPHFNGMWIVTDEWCQLLAPGFYEIVPI